MRYHDITKCDLKNGDGIRVVLWVAGCEHKCPGCQNLVTWNPDDGLIFGDETIKELMCELEKDHVSGITLSGGDPMHRWNRAVILSLCEILKDNFPDKTIWMYTGYTYEYMKNWRILNFIDVLVDGPYVESLRDVSLKWRGSSNQRVIDVKKTMELGQVVLWCD